MKQTAPSRRAEEWKATAIFVAGMLLLIAAVLTLSGCATGPQFVDRPVVTEVVRTVYVEIPRELCVEQPIATGPLSEAPRVANDRKLALERANANARAVCAVQGTDIPQ